jgi:prepilin-type N-terminal cleavage/methylation domain-containing protein
MNLENSMVSSAAIPAASFGGVSLPGKTRGGTPRELAGEDACATHRTSRAFTLIEIMVTITLLVVIVLGLTAMFIQTQKAFRAGMSQTDVLEASRMATDMIVREMQQITPTYRDAVNFYTEIPNYSPLQQTLPASANPRVNILQDLFFTTRQNQTWTGIGYFVRPNGAHNSGMGQVGALYHFQLDKSIAQFGQDPQFLFNVYQNSTTNVTFYPSGTPVATNIVGKILDGVVEFRVRVYDTNGIWMTNGWPSSFNTATIRDSAVAPGEVGLCTLSSNMVPGYVEVELAILEPQVLRKYNSIPDALVQSNYLANHAGNVHVFRQRVPIRNVDPLAYQ